MDNLIEIPRGLHVCEIEPVIVFDGGFIGTIGDVGKILSFLNHKVAHLIEAGQLILVEVFSGVGEVEESEVSDGNGSGFAGDCRPHVHCLGGKDYSLEDDVVYQGSYAEDSQN